MSEPSLASGYQDLQRWRNREKHYLQHPSLPSSEPGSISPYISGIGGWYRDTSPKVGDEETYPGWEDSDEYVEAEESPMELDASTSFSLFNTGNQQPMGGPPTPVTTPRRRTSSTRSPYYTHWSQEAPLTPTHDEIGQRFRRDDFEQDSSNRSYHTANEGADQQPDHQYVASVTTDSSAEGSAGNFYDPSHHTPSHASRDSEDYKNPSSEQPAQPSHPQEYAPQSPRPYSEWDQYNRDYAPNEVQRFQQHYPRVGNTE